MRAHIWSDFHRDLPVRSAELGNDAGIIGAALAAVASLESPRSRTMLQPVVLPDYEALSQHAADLARRAACARSRPR